MMVGFLVENQGWWLEILETTKPNEAGCGGEKGGINGWIFREEKQEESV